MQDATGIPATPASAKKWRPLDRVERRVAGVLVEKAKTTPDNYPLSLNGLVNACNQKSNRSPQMQLDEDAVLEALDRLKGMGAVSEIQGDGRVSKFRHLLYDWLGVDKLELAVMAELLLRGAQTLGELRGRAARMEPIADINTLRPLVEGLVQKGLVVYLTPPGRGCVVTHAVQPPETIEKQRAEYAGGGETQASAAASSAAASSAAGPTPAPTRPTPDLERHVERLEQKVAALEARVTRLEASADG